MLDNIIEIEEGNVEELAKDLAYHDAKDGSSLVKITNNGCELAIFKALSEIPMGYIEGAAFVATLACVHALQKSIDSIEIKWPTTIMHQKSELAQVSVSAGFKNGLFAVITVEFVQKITEDQIDLLVTTVVDELEKWREDVVAKKILAGPVSQCLSEYFDYIPELGHETLVQNPDGKLVFAGTFAGLDVWGHALVVDENNNERSYAPGEAMLISTDQ